MDCDQISYGTGTPVKSGFLPDAAVLRGLSVMAAWAYFGGAGVICAELLLGLCQ